MTTLKKGDKGPQVKEVQDKLLSVGYVLPRFGADSDLGDETISAAKQFAIERRLVPVPDNRGVYESDKRGYAQWASIQSGVLSSELLTAIQSAEPWLRGCDVSDNNGVIDWVKVRASGIRYAWARTSLGKTSKDDAFLRYWPAMKDAGIVRGPYHVVNLKRSASENLDNCKSMVGKLEPGDMYPVLDVEGEEVHPQANAKLTECVDAFAGEYGQVGIYSSERIYKLWKLTTAGKGCFYWGAYYVVGAKHCPVPSPFDTWTVWQSGYGKGVDGVKTLLDYDLLPGGLGKLCVP